MKYWLLTSEFPPDFGGGISTYCRETAHMLAAHGHQVKVITQDFQIKKTTREKKGNITIVRFNPNNYFTTSFLGYEANLSYAFSQIVKELIAINGSPDIIESQEYMGIAYYLLQFKWLQYPEFKNLKILLTLHAPSFLYHEFNNVPHYKFPDFWTGEMERFCIRAADLLISPSKYLVSELKGRMETKDLEIHIVHNPYELVQKYKNIQVQKNKLVFFGKLTPQKGCLKLIQYFKELWEEGFQHTLIMIGNGDHTYHAEGSDMKKHIESKYKAEIASGKLKLIGSVSPEKIEKYLEHVHVVLIPSLTDNLPYTVLEAMGKGKIILASKQGGQSEIITNGVDGFLFDHETPSSFHTQLKHILSLNENGIQKISEHAHFKIKDSFSPKIIYDQKIKLIQDLIKNKIAKNIFPLSRPFAKKKKEYIQHNDKETLLSVIIPYYNMGKYIHECLRSIANTHYKNLEIILVNDGSNETGTEQLLTKLARRYKINIITKKNEGLAMARNEGAKIANGNYLAFLDPDDTIEPTYFEKAIRVLKYFENIHFVGSWANYFGNSKGYWPTFNPEPPYLLVHNMINSSALIYKREAFLQSGSNDPSMIFGMEDYESVISLVKNGFHGVALPEPLWNYRIRDKSMSREFSKNKQIHLYRLIAEKHSDFYSIFGAEVVNLLNANGPGFLYDNPTVYNDLPGNNLLSQSMKNKIITTVKTNKVLRRVAKNIKKFK